MTEVSAYGVTKAKELLKPLTVQRRDLTPFDVLIKILYCGICHSDKHHIYNDWNDIITWSLGKSLVPGHEIIGIVEDIGDNVTTLKIGEHVAVGNMVDSCQHCINCSKSKEQYCLNGGPTWVYNSKERVNRDGSRTLRPEGDITYGGYSSKIVAQEKFVFKLPDGLNLAKSAPLLCAGITMYYPLKTHKIGKGFVVGIAGIGGLGHLGIKFAKALGAQVIALTTTEWKLDDSLDLGADDSILMDNDFINYVNIKHKILSNMPITETEAKLFDNLSYDQDIVLKSEYMGKFDIIINTIPVSHDITPYLNLLKPGEGKLHIVGNMNNYPGLKGMSFVFPGKDITSSNVGGTCDTKEMLQFCANNKIEADIELIKITSVNDAIDKIVNKDVRYRFVIDLTNFY